MKNFKEIIPSLEIIKALDEINIKEPTLIQQKVIPTLLNGASNVIVKAQTGTGKTLAFGLPLVLNTNGENKNIQSLILSPTRELAQQIAKQLFKTTKYIQPKIFIETVYGGEKIDIQISKLRRPTQILVATPGRLIDLLQRKCVRLDNVSTIVLDEADEMLSMGFKTDIDKILNVILNRNKMWLFSATISSEVNQIIDHYMNDEKQLIELEQITINEKIEHQFIQVDNSEKLKKLEKFLFLHQQGRGIIFCNKKSEVITLIDQIKNLSKNAEALHGDMQQKDREKVMRAFKNEKLQILVSTDVSARGIDVKDLAFVIHYSLPQQIEYFIHRSGRTARAGKRGISFALISPTELPKLKALEDALNINFIKASL